jgi:hypothetical protein
VGSTGDDIRRGLDAFDRSEWAAAQQALASAWRAGELEPPELWRLALASFLCGEEDDFLAALEEAHRKHLERGADADALRCAVWLGMHLANRGEMARASGWFGRAGRLLDDGVVEGAADRSALIQEGQRQVIYGEA